MGALDFMQSRPTLADMRAKPCATPKHEIVPNVVSKEERRKAKTQNGKTFRAAVWKRDQDTCRATKVRLAKSGTTDPHILGEVDHVINRSLAPERIYDVSNGILISKFLNRLKKAACPRAPEFHLFEITGPDDRGEKQEFLWRDKDGTVTKRRIG